MIKRAFKFVLFVLFGCAVAGTSGFWWPGHVSTDFATDDKVQYVSQDKLDLHQLDEWISTQEKSLDLKGSQVYSHIDWEPSHIFQVTDLSIVYFHGFSSSPDELSPTIQDLAKTLRANSYFQRFSGHGFKTGQELGDATAEAWLRDAYLGYLIAQKIGKKVVIVATSTGASLAMILIARHLIDPAALIFMSPNFRPSEWYSWVTHGPFGEMTARLVLGPEHAWTPRNPMMDDAWTTRYSVKVLPQLMRLLKVLQNTDLQQIRQPALVLYSGQDRVVSVDLIKTRFLEFGSQNKKIIESPSIQHVLSGKYTSPETVDWTVNQMSEFIAHF